jgi:hypothetical protein
MHSECCAYIYNKEFCISLVFFKAALARPPCLQVPHSAPDPLLAPITAVSTCPCLEVDNGANCNRNPDFFSNDYDSATCPAQTTEATADAPAEAAPVAAQPAPAPGIIVIMRLGDPPHSDVRPDKKRVAVSRKVNRFQL